MDFLGSCSAPSMHPPRPDRAPPRAPHNTQAGIDKLIRILEGEQGESQFNAEQYMRLYT